MSDGPMIQADMATSARQLNHLRAQIALRILIHQFVVDQVFSVFVIE
jgi:hypothetical protein